MKRSLEQQSSETFVWRNDRPLVVPSKVLRDDGLLNMRRMRELGVSISVRLRTLAPVDCVCNKKCLHRYVFVILTYITSRGAMIHACCDPNAPRDIRLDNNINKEKHHPILPFDGAAVYPSTLSCHHSSKKVDELCYICISKSHYRVNVGARYLRVLGRKSWVDISPYKQWSPAIYVNPESVIYDTVTITHIEVMVYEYNKFSKIDAEDKREHTPSKCELDTKRARLDEDTKKFAALVEQYTKLRRDTVIDLNENDSEDEDVASISLLEESGIKTEE